MALEDKIKELLEGKAKGELDAKFTKKDYEQDDSDDKKNDSSEDDNSEDDSEDDSDDKKKKTGKKVTVEIDDMKEEAAADADNGKINAGKGKKLEDKKNAGEPSTAEPNNTKNNVDKNPQGVKEHIDALTAGEALSEDFKAKAAVILEAAIADGVSKELDRLEEEHAQQLDEAVNAVREELVNQIDGFLTTIVEAWVEENELALERGIKGEIVENFIDGLKTLFTEHYIEVPEEKLDILDEQAEQIESLTTALDESVSEIETLKAEVTGLTRARVMESVGDSLTDTEFEKFASLCEGLAYESAETFEEKVKTIKESHFHVTKPNSIIAESDTPVPMNLVEGSMKKYVEALSNPLTFKR